MKVLLDECIDWRLLRDLAGIDATTVKQMGWSETINGAPSPTSTSMCS